MQELHTDRKVDRERFILREHKVIFFSYYLTSNKQYIVSIKMLKSIMIVQFLP